MPRKAVKLPGADTTTKTDTAPAPEAPEPVIKADTTEDAQAKANRINRAVLTPEGWVCPNPDAVAALKAAKKAG